MLIGGLKLLIYGFILLFTGYLTEFIMKYNPPPIIEFMVAICTLLILVICIKRGITLVYLILKNEKDK
jgi:hypothetical protein